MTKEITTIDIRRAVAKQLHDVDKGWDFADYLISDIDPLEIYQLIAELAFADSEQVQKIATSIRDRYDEWQHKVHPVPPEEPWCYEDY